MPAFTARRIAGARPGRRDRDHEAVGLGRDRLVDQLAHPLDAEDVGRLVVDEHVEPARGGVDAVADDRPELARRRAVGDDRDPHRAVGHRRARRGRGARRAGDLRRRGSRTTSVPPQPASRTSAQEDEQPLHSGTGSGRAQPRAVAERAVDLERPADRRDAVLQPADAAARRRVDAADAVVGDLHDERPRRRAGPRPARSTPPRSGRRWSAPRRRGSTRRPRPAPAAAPRPPRRCRSAPSRGRPATGSRAPGRGR